MNERQLVPLFSATAGGIITGHLLQGQLEGAAFFLWFLPVIFGVLALRSRSNRNLLVLLGVFSAGVGLGISAHRPSTLSELALARGVHRIQATVCEPMTVYPRYRRTVILIHTANVDGSKVKLEEYATLRIYGPSVHMNPGDGLDLHVRLSPFRNFNNPGGYDHAGAMALRGIACNAYRVGNRPMKITGDGRLPPGRRLIEKVRRPVRDFFKAQLEPGEPRALIRALVLGERQELPRELRRSFSRTGLGHVLAVSGLHIGLVGWASFKVFSLVMSLSYRLSVAVVVARWAALLSILPVVMYTCLAGFQISSRRAMIMVCTYLIAMFIDRRKDLWSTLALAGLIITVLDPRSLFTVSFQLSFTAVAAIIWLAPTVIKAADPVVNAFPGRFPRAVASYFVGLVVLSLVVTVFLSPLMAYYFNRLSIITVPANVTVLPILGIVVVPLGLLSAFTCVIFPTVAGVLAAATEVGVKAMIGLVKFWDSFPVTGIHVPTPNVGEVLLLYVLLCFGVLSIRHGRARAVLYAAMVVFLVDVGYWTHRVWFHSDLRVTFLNVGHGNAAVVEIPGGRKLVIDGGGFSGGGFDTGEMLVAPFLWSRKIMSVDYMALSHPHTDHMGGLEFMARHFSPREFWHSGTSSPLPSFSALMETLEALGVPIRAPPELPEAIEIKGVNIDILHPPGTHDPHMPPEDSSAVNDLSLVMRVCFKGTCILFPGDIEQGTETALSREKPDLLRSHILLVPHHGSRSSSTPVFLNSVLPEISVISARNGGHPEVRSRLEALGSPVLVTSENGAVEVTVNREGYNVRTFLPMEKLPR